MSWSERLDNLDRRIIYLFVAISLAIPIILEVTLPPAPLDASSDFFEAVDSLESNSEKLVLIAADWGPGTQAENGPQVAVAVEHLMRKRIPFAMISIYGLASPFLKEIPLEVKAKLEKEMPSETWTYGTDWVNWGFRPGGIPMVQGLARSSNLHFELKQDAFGAPIEDIPLMKNIKTIEDIAMLMEFTGLVGAFNLWIQFFQSEKYRPPFVHGCTSITIPEAHIYLASKQIIGLHEGLAGAAWYEHRLGNAYPDRTPGKAIRINTGLAMAQLMVLFFILVGNIGYLRRAIK